MPCIFRWCFILGHGAFRWSLFLGRCLGCFRHSIFICSSLTFLCHMDNISFFLLISFDRFQWENYVGMWGHYRSKIMWIFLRPFSKTSSLTIDILCWYMPSFYGKLCPIYFFGELCFSGTYLWFKFHIFDKHVLEKHVYQVEEGPHYINHVYM